MARTQQLELDLPVDLKAATASVKSAADPVSGLKAQALPSDRLASARNAGLKPWSRKKAQADQEQQAALAQGAQDAALAEVIEAAVQGDQAVQLAQTQTETLMPGLDLVGQTSTDIGGPVQLAQLELPTQPSSPSAASAGATAGGGASGAAGTGAVGSFGGLGGVFGAAAGLGLAAGGGGGGKSAGSASPVVLPAPTTAAPVPTAPANDVISLFSDSYTNVPVNSWDPQWGGQTGDFCEGPPSH
jgi:hypothetical protein